MKHYTLTAADRKAVGKLLSQVRSEPPRPAYPSQPWALTKTAESLWALPPCQIGLPGALLRDDGGIDAIGVSCCIFKQNKTNGKLEQMFDSNNLPIRYMVYNHYTISTNQLVQIFQHKDGHWSNERPERVVNVAPPTSTQRPTQGDFTEATCEGECISFSDGNGNWAWPQGGCQNRPTTTTNTTTTSVPTSTTPAPNRCCINGECFGYGQAYCEARGGAFGDCDTLNCTTTLPPCYDTKCYLKCERAYPATPTDPGLFYVEDPDSLIVGESPCALAQEAVGADPAGCNCYGIGDPCFVEDGLIESLCIGEARSTTTTTPSPETLVPPGSDLCLVALEFLQGELSPEEFAELTSEGDWYVTRNGSGNWTQCQACSDVNAALVPNTELGGGRLISISVPYGTGAQANVYPALTVHATGCSRNSCLALGQVADIYDGFAAYGMEVPNGDEIVLNGPNATSTWYYNQWQECQACEGSSRPAVAPPFYMAHELSQQTGTNLSVSPNGSGYMYYSECVQGIRCDACAMGEIDINGRRIGGPRTQPIATTTPGPDTEGLCCAYVDSVSIRAYSVTVDTSPMTYSACQSDISGDRTVFYAGNPANVSNDDLVSQAVSKNTLFCLDAYLATTTTTSAPCGCIRPDYCPEPYECSITPCVRGGEIVAGAPTPAPERRGACCVRYTGPAITGREELQECYQLTEAQCNDLVFSNALLDPAWLGPNTSCVDDCYTAVTTTTTGTTSAPPTTTSRFPCFPDNTTTTGTSTSSTNPPTIPGYCYDAFNTLCDCGTTTSTTTSGPPGTLPPISPGVCPPGTALECTDPCTCTCVVVPEATTQPPIPPGPCVCGGYVRYRCVNRYQVGETDTYWFPIEASCYDGCWYGGANPQCIPTVPTDPCECGAEVTIPCAYANGGNIDDIEFPGGTPYPTTSPRPCACCSTPAPNLCAQLCRFKGNGVGGWDLVFDECPESCPCANAGDIAIVSENECDTLRLGCGQVPPTSTTSTTSTTPAFCCLPDGCIVKYGAPCDGVTEVTAPEANCESCFGACCYFDDGAYYCLSSTSQGCDLLAGVWTQGAACGSISCGSTPPPTSAPPTTTAPLRGACCWPNGACSDGFTEAGCLGGTPGAGCITCGTWLGAGTSCAVNGASCSTTTTTTTSTTTTTTAAPTTTTTTTTTSTTTSTTTRDPNIGACCFEDTGTCINSLTAAQCEAGTWYAATLCSELVIPCTTTTTTTTSTTTTTTTSTTTTTTTTENSSSNGACCIGGVCFPGYSFESCSGSGGTYQGNGTDCGTALCEGID